VLDSNNGNVVLWQCLRLVEQQRSQMLPLADLAELLAEENQEWAETDLEDGYVSDRANARNELRETVLAALS
jgi:hypothetical protein